MFPSSRRVTEWPYKSASGRWNRNEGGIPACRKWFSHWKRKVSQQPLITEVFRQKQTPASVRTQRNNSKQFLHIWQLTKKQDLILVDTTERTEQELRLCVETEVICTASSITFFVWRANEAWAIWEKNKIPIICSENLILDYDFW